MDELEFQAQFGPRQGGTLAEVLAHRAAPDPAEIREAVAEKTMAEARAARREELALANRAYGNPFGEVSRHQLAIAECRAKRADLEAQLGKIAEEETRLARNRDYWQDQADEVRRSVDRTGSTGDLLGPAKAALARHQEFVSNTRTAIAKAVR